MTDGREAWPAPERNKAPILEVLQRVVPRGARVLEVASGTGQHAAHFARSLSVASWQPTDLDRAHHPSIAAWTADLENVAAVVALDVTDDPWPVGDARYDVIFCANMIHIAPFAACLGLLRGAGAHLERGGCLCLYGPFMLDGVHTSESNAQFDQRLRERDPGWGVRDLTVVATHAAEHGLTLEERVPMPANNQTVVFRRG